MQLTVGPSRLTPGNKRVFEPSSFNDQGFGGVTPPAALTTFAASAVFLSSCFPCHLRCFCCRRLCYSKSDPLELDPNANGGRLENLKIATIIINSGDETFELLTIPASLGPFPWPSPMYLPFSVCY